MDIINYRDLLWDFTVVDGQQQRDSRRLASEEMQYLDRWQGEVRLRVFTSEKQSFEARNDPSMAHNIILRLDWPTPTPDSNFSWTRSLPDEYWLRKLGQQLWDTIPADARQPLWEATVEQPCRLKISSNSSAIDDLPWEWMNDGNGLPFALRPEIRLARSVSARVASPPSSVTPPVHVLLMITNPKDERYLNPFVEINAVLPGLSKSPYQSHILEEPTWEALIGTLKEYNPDIVHYIGHAGIDRGAGNLILHDSQNLTHWISGADLAKALPLSVRLLCLSTCFTAPNYQILGLPRLAHTSPTSRLPTVVTNCYPVREAGVKSFWSRFYDGLAEFSGNTVEAFSQAQQALAALPEAGADWGSFSLVIRDHSGQGLRIERSRARPKSAKKKFKETQAQIASQLANELAQTLLGYGDSPPENLQQVYRKLASKASGKTKEQL